MLSELLSSSSIVKLNNHLGSSQSGLVYQILFHLTGFTQCAWIGLCLLDFFAYVNTSVN